MTQEHSGGDHGQGEHGGRPKYLYFVDGTKYDHDSSSITGAVIRSRIPGLSPSYGLFLEGKGGEPDRAIGDTDGVSLEGGAPHLYTAPPATFGR